MSQKIIPKYMLKYIKTNFSENDSSKIIENASNIIEKLKHDCEHYSADQKKQLFSSIFPAIGIYKALQNTGLPADKSYNHMQKMINGNTELTVKKMWQRLGKLPFFFSMFRKMFSWGLKKDLWEVEWTNNTSDKFEYNITRCLWNDAFSKHGYPELCKIYCNNDDICYTNASKYMSFNRTRTLTDGNSCCDFSFHKSNKI